MSSLFAVLPRESCTQSLSENSCADFVANAVLWRLNFHRSADQRPKRSEPVEEYSKKVTEGEVGGGLFELRTGQGRQGRLD